ncbi:hypothetical protein HON01_02400 [Candidatus Woesearchaeota archaeon]|jgi:hypothetical protein|nr:hypothetical protein [Candidatus Woesearchaeota archaeon]MBT7367401.1 hypothetical protein [Candidatus Woesearchaeota archaeon]
MKTKQKTVKQKSAKHKINKKTLKTVTVKKKKPISKSNIFKKLIKKNSTSSKSNSRKSHLKNSVKLDSRFWKTALYELIIILFIVVAIMFWTNRMTAIQLESYDLLYKEGTMSDPATSMLMEQAFTEFTREILVFSGLSIVFALASLLFFKSLIYLTIWKEKFNWKYLGKYSLMALLWSVIFVPLTVIINFGLFNVVSENLSSRFWAQATFIVVPLVFTVLSFYLTCIFFLIFSKKQKMWESIKLFYKIGILQFKKFRVPILFTGFLFFLINTIMFGFLFLGQWVFLFGSTILFIVYFCWLRLYFWNYVKELI